MVKFICLNCGNNIIDKKHTNRKFCNNKCQREFISKEKFSIKQERYKSGQMRDEEARVFFRLINEKTCSICKLKEWMGEEIPLEVDHIDGNHENNFPENLRFVCCNCGGLLPTYKGRNKGRGREYRHSLYNLL